MRRLTWLAVCVLGSLLIGNRAEGADDGRRAVEVKRYGITVRVPQAWRLITWGRDDEAFVLKLPQDGGSKTGFVTCTLGLAPESLEDYQKRIARRDAAQAGNEVAGDKPPRAAQPEPVIPGEPPAPPVKRKLLVNTIEPLDEARFGKKMAEQLHTRLLTTWELTNEKGDQTFEVITRVVHDGSLYTFTLATDEAHFDAYRADFDDMLVSAIFTIPETGLRRMPGGYWMQRDFRFALRLPDGWRPAFGPDDKVLFFASGATHEVFTDNLLVLASPPRLLDLDALKASLPGQVAKIDNRATVDCRIVPQGGALALETEIHTTRGNIAISILERRFSSRTRNYEIKFTCETSEFKKLAEQLKAALDSFVEVLDEPGRGEA